MLKTPTKDSYYRDRDLAALFKVGRNTIWRWVSTGHLPPPVKLSPHCSRWRASDLDAWDVWQKGTE